MLCIANKNVVIEPRKIQDKLQEKKNFLDITTTFRGELEEKTIDRSSLFRKNWTNPYVRTNRSPLFNSFLLMFQSSKNSLILFTGQLSQHTQFNPKIFLISDKK